VKFKEYAELVKFEHTIFALPFALAAVVLLAKNTPSVKEVFWITVALISARTLGMALNRLIDEPYDRLNPRTKHWPLVSGKVSKKEVWSLIFLSASVFLLSCALINTLTLLLSPFVILILWVYPYAKRFTYFPHLFLGTVYFLIPIAVDVALNERISTNALILGTAMGSWVSGFDILYSLQDVEFDRKHGLKSIAVKFGTSGALRFAKGLHFLTFLALLVLGLRHPDLGSIYFTGFALLSLFLIYEHLLIKPTDISKINRAFFTINGYISILFFITVFADKLL